MEREPMRIICVDDEELVLQLTLMMCRSLSYVDQAEGFTSPADALAWLDGNEADAALLDIDMPEMSGLALAAKIKEKYPDISVVFTTGYAQFAVDAFALHASGYLMKPLSKERIDEELRYARENRQEIRAFSHLSAVTFGNFDLLIDGKPLSFPRSKSKELMAYLVDRQAHPKRSLEAESFNSDRMNGKVFTAEELKNQAKNRLRVRFTEDSCAQLMAVRNLSKGKNGAMITPEALEKEKARLMQGGSAFRRAMSSSAEREEYKKMAEKGQISDLTEALRKSTRNHAVGASQFRLNRAANALTEGPVNKHFASQYLSEILLAHEISTKMDPGLRTSNQGFAAGAEQIRKDPAFGQLVDKYMTDEVFRNRMNKDLQLDKTGGMLALEYHKMKAPAKQAEAQQNEAQPQPQPAV